MTRIIRDDLSERLIHLTRNVDDKDAKQRFLEILKSKSLKGTNTDIRGRHKCICFSEAPISSLGQIIARKSREFRYAPYGFMFSKEYLFSLGARPVLYQTEEEYKLLPEDFQYKHVKFDLSQEPKIDWTWEREWRLKMDELRLDIRRTTVILPNRSIMEELISQYQIQFRTLSTRAFGLFPQIDWHFIILDDLGFTLQ